MKLLLAQFNYRRWCLLQLNVNKDTSSNEKPIRSLSGLLFFGVLKWSLMSFFWQLWQLISKFL